MWRLFMKSNNQLKLKAHHKALWRFVLVFANPCHLMAKHKQTLCLILVGSSMSSPCPGLQRSEQAAEATVTLACCRGIWAGASLACLRLVYGLWKAGSAARDSCWTCLVVNFTATFYLLMVMSGPLSFTSKQVRSELVTAALPSLHSLKPLVL